MLSCKHHFPASFILLLQSFEKQQVEISTYIQTVNYKQPLTLTPKVDPIMTSFSQTLIITFCHLLELQDNHKTSYDNESLKQSVFRNERIHTRCIFFFCRFLFQELFGLFL